MEVSPGAVEVSVVLPVHNEAGHLRTEVDRIRKAFEADGRAYEIVLVDDGSTDGSLDEVADLLGPDGRTSPDGTLRVIRFAQNKGSGAARRAGTRAARGEVVVWTDADMTYPNDRMPALVDALAGHDQVVGARRAEKGTLRALRVPTKWFIRRLASFLVERPIPDLNSGFRAFRRPVGLQFVDQLPDGFSCVTTLTMTFLANGYSVHYVPIDYAARSGHSKFHWWRDTRRYLTQVVRLVLSYNPLRIFLPIGMALLAAGLGKLGFDLFDKHLRVGTNTLLILFAAFQTLAIGLLADLIVRVTRPHCDVEPAQRP